jgi:hypothetical protein
LAVIITANVDIGIRLVQGKRNEAARRSYILNQRESPEGFSFAALE